MLEHRVEMSFPSPPALLAFLSTENASCHSRIVVAGPGLIVAGLSLRKNRRAKDWEQRRRWV